MRGKGKEEGSENEGGAVERANHLPGAGCLYL